MDEKERDDMLAALKDGFENKIPFHRILRIKIDSISLDGVTMKITMNEDFIGNVIQKMLHGGVISSMLDIVGGLTSTLGLLKQAEDRPLDDELIERIFKIGTIDLRVDYLKPGKGDWFIASGAVMRTGRFVSVTRMELHNDRDELIAVGTGTYKIG